MKTQTKETNYVMTRFNKKISLNSRRGTITAAQSFVIGKFDSLVYTAASTAEFSPAHFFFLGRFAFGAFGADGSSNSERMSSRESFGLSS